MKIGIDISQLAYEKTGVANYLANLVEQLLLVDKKNEYILFYSSLRKNIDHQISKIKKINSNVKINKFKFPPSFLDLLWNKLHIAPIEWFTGDLDLFISSDWTEPPVIKAKKATILYDLIVYKFPNETHNKTEFNLMKLRISPNIVKSQKQRLKWVKRESDMIFCISESTKKDAKEILGIDENRLKVIYPGI